MVDPVTPLLSLPLHELRRMAEAGNGFARAACIRKMNLRAIAWEGRVDVPQ